MSVAIQKWEKHHAGLVMLRVLTKRLLRAISNLPSTGTDHNILESDEDVEETKVIPTDVKEGHFVVIAAEGGKQKRFVLELRYLRNLEFLGLLEQAKEEYGFRQEGVLVLPCQPEELQKILEDGATTKLNR
ncbi:hypothetical protein DITRI_Ditri06bG0058900 [Diplodiscus trichospermus]